MSYLWATRGRLWGFRFLRDGGISDPLPTYSNAFLGLDAERELVLHRRGVVALRFEDPLGRLDRAGRLIPHDFVLLDARATAIDSVAAGVNLVWPMVRDEYAGLYGLSAFVGNRDQNDSMAALFPAAPTRPIDPTLS